MDFRISGLAAEPFRHLYGLPEEELRRHGVVRYTVNEKPGFPDRVELREAEAGETVLLLNHLHQPADTPYRASHAVFVREGATETYGRNNHVPESLRIRLISLRAFSAEGMMLDADVVQGTEFESLVKRLFSDPAVDYIHAHNAKQGCYAARIDRIS